MKILLAVCLLLSFGLPMASAAPVPDPMNDAPPAGYYVFQKVVYQNNSGWPDDRGYFERLLRNLAAHITATDGKVEIRVVSFSSGVRLFQMAKTDGRISTVSRLPMSCRAVSQKLHDSKALASCTFIHSE